MTRTTEARTGNKVLAKAGRNGINVPLVKGLTLVIHSNVVQNIANIVNAKNIMCYKKQASINPLDIYLEVRKELNEVFQVDERTALEQQILLCSLLRCIEFNQMVSKKDDFTGCFF